MNLDSAMSFLLHNEFPSVWMDKKGLRTFGLAFFQNIYLHCVFQGNLGDLFFTFSTNFFARKTVFRKMSHSATAIRTQSFCFRSQTFLLTKKKTIFNLTTKTYDHDGRATCCCGCSSPPLLRWSGISSINLFQISMKLMIDETCTTKISNPSESPSRNKALKSLP